jgi:hypothetical protein
VGRSLAGISIDFAYAKRLKSLFRRAGDQKTASTGLGPAGPRVLAVSWRYFVSLGPSGQKNSSGRTLATNLQKIT